MLSTDISCSPGREAIIYLHKQGPGPEEIPLCLSKLMYKIIAFYEDVPASQEMQIHVKTKGIGRAGVGAQVAK